MCRNSSALHITACLSKALTEPVVRATQNIRRTNGRIGNTPRDCPQFFFEFTGYILQLQRSYLTINISLLQYDTGDVPYNLITSLKFQFEIVVLHFFSVCISYYVCKLFTYLIN